MGPRAGQRLWYGEQHVLNTSPPIGCFLYQRINQFTVDYFCRDSSGTETMQQYANVLWRVYGAYDELISVGLATTTANGWVSFVPSVPESYGGRLRVVASATSLAGEIVATSYMIAGSTAGVFGVVPEYTTGTITVRGAGSGRPVSVPVLNGAFSLPTLGGRRGQFTAEFVSPSGVRLSKVFNKDASPYFLEIK